MEVANKLKILTDAAKYDASCASSGVVRRGAPGGLGNSDGTGICHSYTPDGRCVSLLKILLTNFCIFDCQYCVNRVSSDVPRARFSAPRRRRRGPPDHEAPSTTVRAGGPDHADDRRGEQQSRRILLRTASELYQRHHLRRVYYSAFSPFPQAPGWLPPVSPPQLREHRLYQADWLMRHYGFTHDELTTVDAPDLPLNMSPKLAWALRHPEVFPIDVNTAPRELLLRVPGIGYQMVKRLVRVRRHHRLELRDLRRLRVRLSEARHFIVTADSRPTAPLMTIVQPVQQRLL